MTSGTSGGSLTSAEVERREDLADFLWAVAPACSGAIGVLGFLLLAAEILASFDHGWHPIRLGDVLQPLQRWAEEGGVSYSHLLLDLPFGLALVCAAPCLFRVLVAVGAWLDGPEPKR